MKVKILVETFVQGTLRKPGEVLEVPEGLGRSMIQARRAEEVKVKKQKAEKTAPEKAVK